MPNKLNHLQKRYAQKYVEEGEEQYQSMVDHVVEIAQEYLQIHPKYGSLPSLAFPNSRSHRVRLHGDDNLSQKAATLLHADAGNYTTPREFFERNRHFFCIEPRKQYKQRPDDYKLKDSMHLIGNQFKEIPLEKWDEQHLQQAFRSMIEQMLGVWYVEHPASEASREIRNAAQHFLRWALTGGRPGPTVIACMGLLGRDVSLSRIEDAAAAFKDMEFEAQSQGQMTP